MKFTTGMARLSYAHIFKAVVPMSGGDPKFSAAILIPKKDTKTIERLKAAIKSVKDDPGSVRKWQDRNGRVGNVDIPIHDGDQEKPDDPNYKGMLYFNAKASEDRPPKIYMKDLAECTDPSEVYSGCWVQASVSFYPYNANGHKGIGVGLNGIRKLKDGEHLSGGSVSASDFSDDLIDPNDISDDDLLG